MITGAASGIGADTALLFGQEGATVVGVDLNPGSVGELAIEADVTDEAQVASMYDLARDKFGRVDVLFNNAGINPNDDSERCSTPPSTPGSACRT